MSFCDIRWVFPDRITINVISISHLQNHFIMLQYSRVSKMPSKHISISSLLQEFCLQQNWNVLQELEVPVILS